MRQSHRLVQVVRGPLSQANLDTCVSASFTPSCMRLHQFPSKHVPRTSIIGFSIGHPHRTMTDGVPVIATLNYEHVPSAAHFGVPMLQRRPLAFCPKRQPCRVRKRGCSGGGGIIKSMHFWQTNSSLRNVSCSLCARQCNPPTRSFMPNTEIINLAFAFTFALPFTLLSLLRLTLLPCPKVPIVVRTSLGRSLPSGGITNIRTSLSAKINL